MDELGCAVNHVLSLHGFRFLLIFFRSLLGYLKDCNVAASSVDSHIFYVVISGFQVLHYNLYFLKQCQIVVCKLVVYVLQFPFVLIINFSSSDLRIRPRRRDC